MSDVPKPLIEQGPPKVDRAITPKQAEQATEMKPLGREEQIIIKRIREGGEGDKILRDIVAGGEKTQAGDSKKELPDTERQKAQDAIREHLADQSADRESVVNKQTEPESDKLTTGEQLQRETYGRLYGDLLTAFAETPDITKEELMRRVSTYIKEHRLAGPNVGRAVGMVGRFCRAREVVRTTREKFPDDRMLFEHTFGFTPQGEVHVIAGTTDLSFVIPNAEDRARARGDGAKYEGGARIDTVHDSSLNGLVIALSEAPQYLVNHERTHVVNHEILKMMEPDSVSPYELLKSIQPGENVQTSISGFFEALRSSRFRGAADEVIAYFSSGASPNSIRYLLTAEESNYARKFRGMNSALEGELVGQAGESSLPYIREQADRMLGQEYDQTITSSIDAFQNLRSRGLSQEQATGYLAFVPFSEWGDYVAGMPIKLP